MEIPNSCTEVSRWRCPQCTENALEPDNSHNESGQDEAHSRARRRSSTSRFTRDLLPAHRGLSRPGSHSVFNTLILDDDPLDGSRSLRKRKASSEQADLVPQKRPRKQSSQPEKSPERILAEKIEALSHGDKSSATASLRGGGGSSRPSRTPKRHGSDDALVGHVTVIKRKRNSLILSFSIPPAKLRAIFQARKKRERPSRASISEAPPERHRPQTAHYATPFYAFHERENDELKSKPYGGILSETDAETTRTLPLQLDRKKFNEARTKAEEERKERAALSEAENESKGRSQKVAGPPSKIKCVYFGGHEIETWYAAPYPEEYSRNRVLYLCEFCLKYMSSDYVAWRHRLKCPAKHPPGDEIYRDKSISIFEVDGRKNPVYCQNLCLLAKLFLGSKTLYYDVEPFLFYVMTECDHLGCHFVGYFSKEKRPSSLNNVSCILTLPTHQRKGYGNLLISFSYLLTRVEGKTGSPEKPLSDMGLVSYRNYWRLILSYELLDQIGPISVTELSERTGMTADDIVAALEGLRAMVRDPVTKQYALRLDYEYFKQCIEQWEFKNYVTINPDALVWTPYIMGRSNLAHYETAPPLPTVAPREDEEEDPQVQPEEGVQQAAIAKAIGADSNSGKANESAIADDEEEAPKINGVSSEEAQLANQLNADHPAHTFIPMAPPAATSPGKTNGTLAETPVPEAPPSIPPVRYEIFPPIPGTQARIKPKRGGWRGGPRKSINGNTPAITPATVRAGGKPALTPATPNQNLMNHSGSSSSSSTRRRTRQAGPVEKMDDGLDLSGTGSKKKKDFIGQVDGADEQDEEEDGTDDSQDDDEEMPDAEGEEDSNVGKEIPADDDYGGEEEDDEEEGEAESIEESEEVDENDVAVEDDSNESD